jgi:hypothetical protein
LVTRILVCFGPWLCRYLLRIHVDWLFEG